MLELRPSTKADIVSLYGGRHKRSMKAITAVLDGAPVGIAGIYFDRGRVVAFSEIKEELRRYPIAIYKAARIVREMIIKMNVPVIAIASPSVDGAGELLHHLGFDHIDTSKAGEVYQWNPE